MENFNYRDKKIYSMTILLIHSSFYRLIKRFERLVKEEESRNTPDINRMLNERNKSMVVFTL